VRPPAIPSNSSKIFLSEAFTFSPTVRPHKSFSCNTYGSPRKCCKQKTYAKAKSFRFRTYKKQGWGPRLATRMCILSPPTAEEPTHGSDHVGKDSSPASLLARSFHSLHQECFTTLLQSTASALFLKTAGVSPYNFHSGNCSKDTTPKGHFFRPLLSTAYTLFQVPYPVSPLPGTLTKTAGCIPTLPILKLAARYSSSADHPVLESSGPQSYCGWVT